MIQVFTVEVECRDNSSQKFEFSIDGTAEPCLSEACMEGLQLKPGWVAELARRTWGAIERGGLVSSDLRWWKLILPNAAPSVIPGRSFNDVLVLYWHSIPNRIYGGEEPIQL